jgi:UDP-N-acetylglucosamine--dolichyl-phosphate N-acetylglucosaminephosphotransferase
MDGLLVYLVVLAFSFTVTFGFLKVLIPRLKAAGIIGKDVNKPDKPEVAEMGGIAIIAGFTASIMLVIMLDTFFGFEINLIHLLAGLIVVHSIAFIGIVDDLINIPQYVKAVLPIFAAVPLIALRAAGSTTMAVPFIGELDFGLFYLLVLVPIGIAVASNLTNMLAGYNGLEAGMGIIIFSVASIIAYHSNATVSFFLFLSFLGALIAFFLFNRYPAKVFPGDVGALSIGATLATGVIIGNMESVGALLLLPYVVDFFIKLANKLPSKEWWGEYKGGKLYPVGGKVRGFCQLVMKLTNGISEQNLVLVFFAIEALVGIIVLLLFLH